MKMSVAGIRKWVQRISDDYMHYDAEEMERVIWMAQYLESEELPDDSGVIGYLVYKDFDCKKKLSVVLFYCRPEYRGRYLSYMFRRLEEIARQEGAVKIFIGDSFSGYKEEKFNHALERYGYRSSGHVKEV